MRSLLAEAVAEFHLAPGQTYRATVNGVEVQLHRPPEAKPGPAPAPDEEPSQFADMVMLDPWADLGAIASHNSITVTAHLGEPIWPSPIIIDDSDLVAE